MDNAGEGGDWGIALFGILYGKSKGKWVSWRFSQSKGFEGQKGSTVVPDPSDVAGFNEFMKRSMDWLSKELL